MCMIKCYTNCLKKNLNTCMPYLNKTYLIRIITELQCSNFTDKFCEHKYIC